MRPDSRLQRDRLKQLGLILSHECAVGVTAGRGVRRRDLTGHNKYQASEGAGFWKRYQHEAHAQWGPLQGADLTLGSVDLLTELAPERGAVPCPLLGRTFVSTDAQLKACSVRHVEWLSPSTSDATLPTGRPLLGRWLHNDPGSKAHAVRVSVLSTPRVRAVP